MPTTAGSTDSTITLADYIADYQLSFRCATLSLKELLVQVDQTEEAAVRLRLAMELACHHSSRLTTLFVDESNIGQLDQKPSVELTDPVHTASRRLRNELETYHQRHGLEFEWQYVREFADSAVKRAAPYADLCVLGHEGHSNTAAADRGFCAKVVVGVGTPLLFIPNLTELSTAGHRIVIAWDGSRSAARAVNDALSLIERADQVTVLNVDSGLQEQSAAALNRLRERLRRHCPHAEARQIELQAHLSVGDALQSEALQLGGDLIVAGAFGKSRLTERIFGGVTRDLLERMRIPLLLAH